MLASMAHTTTLLLVEDNDLEILRVQRALARTKCLSLVRTVKNGPEAMNYLEGTGRFRNRDVFPFPETVLLDLSLPGIDGFELLSWIRSQPSLARLRVIVLLSPDSIRDASRAYQLGADSFLLKPADFENPTCLDRTLASRRRFRPTVVREFAEFPAAVLA